MENYANSDIVYLNCQGFLNNKDEILLLIRNWKPKVILMSETHVTDDISESELKIEGYRIELCKSTNKRTGGVIALINNGIKYKMRNNECVQDSVWLLSIEVIAAESKYLLSVLYHSPQKENAQFVEYFSDYLERVSEYDGIIVIMGDFNFDLLKPNFYGTKLMEKVYLKGFTQLVSSPTRITINSATLIDYIITNNKYLPHSVHLTPKISDHNILTTSLKEKIKDDNYVTIYKRVMNKYNPTFLQNFIIGNNWNNDITDVNVLANSFIDNLSYVMNEMCPIQKIVTKRQYEEKKWITNDIKSMMRDRDVLYKRAILSKSNNTWNEYKFIRNKIIKQINIEKNKFYVNKIDNNKHNAYELWKHLKTLLPEKNPSLPDLIKFEGGAIVDRSCIANQFNKYFVNSVADIINGIPPNAHLEDVTEIVSGNKSSIDVFKQISMADLKKHIKLMKQVGGDENGISTKVFKDVMDVAANRILDVINASLSSGVFPELWKCSTIVPIPKVTNSNLCSDFRPINKVPVYEKLLEMVVKEQVQNFFSENNILVSNQSGFRQGHSCETVIINICDEFRKSIDKNNYVLAVFLDFKRAFETINRDTLIKKMNKMGFKGTVLKWFQSYLHNRTQTVKFKNSTSDCIVINNGVPQGTVLGPFLFLLYINDIVKTVKYTKIELFADDTMIYICGPNISQLQDYINYDINSLSKWLCSNSLSVNVNKTKFCVFGKQHLLSKLDISNVHISLRNQQISYDKQIKYLGVIFDANLTFYEHALYITRKFSKKVNFIARVGRNLSVSTKLLLYNSIAAPHLEFCSTLFYNLPAYILNDLQTIQNRAMRIILKSNRYTPIKIMLNVLDFLTVKQKTVFNTFVFIYKIKNKLLPSYLCGKATNFSDVHNYNTRNKNDFVLTNKCNTESLASTVLCRGLYEFNCLPVNIKICENLDKFKQHLREYVLLKY